MQVPAACNMGLLQNAMTGRSSMYPTFLASLDRSGHLIQASATFKDKGRSGASMFRKLVQPPPVPVKGQIAGRSPLEHPQSSEVIIH